MRLPDFDYELPEGRIAQEPLPRRDASRLLALDRATGALAHLRFSDLPRLLRAGDLLVLNDTRVVPARLRGKKETGGAVEALLLEREGGGRAAPVRRCLLDASKPPRPGVRIDFGHGLRAEVLSRSGEGWSVRLTSEDGDPEAAALRAGAVPLPPYIRRGPGDPRSALDVERYQTVYAAKPGAVAAPTAGLHFTADLLDRLQGLGVETARLTLHVGPGTFLPVRSERIEDHRMHAEAFDLPGETAEAIGRARRRGGRVVAVGTTVVRTLEGRASGDGSVAAGSGSCDLFIRPGHAFRAVDAMVTNFHLPRSTLLMLVCAFGGRERILAAYAEAVREGYRFYSYGDAMFVGWTP